MSVDKFHARWRLLFLYLIKTYSSADCLLEVIIALNENMPTCTPGGGGVLPYKRLMGMCRWMGSHFHDWIDYNGVTFLVELLEWGRTFSGFLG